MGDERSKTVAEVETRMRQKMRIQSRNSVAVVVAPLGQQSQPPPLAHFFPTLFAVASTAGLTWLCRRWFAR